MRFERRQRFRRLHSRNQPQIQFRDRLVRQNGLPAGPGVTADQSFDVYRRLGYEPFQRLVPRQIVNPMLHAEGLLALLFALRLAASAIIFFSSAVRGRGLGKPSIVVSFPSAETSVFSAFTRCQAGLSSLALCEE